MALASGGKPAGCAGDHGGGVSSLDYRGDGMVAMVEGVDGFTYLGGREGWRSLETVLGGIQEDVGKAIGCESGGFAEVCVDSVPEVLVEGGGGSAAAELGFHVVPPGDGRRA